MNAVKERILGAVTVMNNADISRLWDIISHEFGNNKADWDAIPEETPDEIDLQMLQEIESDPDCHEFISSDEARRLLSV